MAPVDEGSTPSTPVFVKPNAVPGPSEEVQALAPTSRVPDGLPHELYEARIPIVAALKTEGYSSRRIAKILKMRTEGVAWCVRKARERDLLKKGLEEAIQKLDDEGVPLAVEGLLRKLQRGEEASIFKILEGRGVFRNFSQVKSEGDGSRSNMAFQFVFTGGPPARDGAIPVDAVPTGLPGQVFGVERTD